MLDSYVIMSYDISMPRKTKARVNNLCVCYLRVSTEEQHLGPEAQRAAITEWAERTKHTIVEFHQDLGISGAASIDKRPGLAAALAAVKRTKASALVVAKVDRLARDATLAGLLDIEVRRLGARILSADGVGAGEGAESELIRGIMNQFAAYERALIRARTSAALQTKKRRGETTGQTPYGFTLGIDGVHLVKLASEQLIIQHILRLRAEGQSFRAITERLNQAGIPARARNTKGQAQGVGAPGRWHLPAVFHIFTRQTEE